MQGTNKTFAQVWTIGNPGDAYRNALSHFNKHQTVGMQTFDTVDAYVAAAHGFIRTAQESFAQHKKGNVQIFVTFDRQLQTGVMLVQENGGRIASFYNLNNQDAQMNGHRDVVSQLVTLSGYKQEYWQAPGPDDTSKQTPFGSFSPFPGNSSGDHDNKFGHHNNDQGGSPFGSLGSSQSGVRRRTRRCRRRNERQRSAGWSTMASTGAKMRSPRSRARTRAP